MSAHNYDTLSEHIGHKLECVFYGDANGDANVAVECVPCGVVLLSFDADYSDDHYTGPRGRDADDEARHQMAEAQHLKR